MLNDSVAAELGIPATFPVSKGLIFAEAQKEARMRELHAFVQSCATASQARYEGEGKGPPELLSFLFTPAKVWGVRQILSSSSFDQVPSERGEPASNPEVRTAEGDSFSFQHPSPAASAHPPAK